MKVSICIPVYNMASSVERTIRSALAQTYPDIEVLVMDNQSTDGTFERARQIQDPRLRVVRNERNLGCYGNHNRCLESAAGEWIKFLHGDDELLLHCIERMIGVLPFCPEDTALLGCGGIILNDKDKEIERTYVPARLVRMRKTPVSECILYGHLFGTPTMTLLHRRRLLDAGGFDPATEPSSDGDCWINLRTRYSCAMLPEYLVVLRDDPPSPLPKRSQEVTARCRRTIYRVERWYRRDPRFSEQPFGKTPYARSLCFETFRFWDAAFFHLLQGYPQVLKALVGDLARFHMVFSSLFFYLGRRLSGKNSRTLRKEPWPVALAPFVLQDTDPVSVHAENL